MSYTSSERFPQGEIVVRLLTDSGESMEMGLARFHELSSAANKIIKKELDAAYNNDDDFELGAKEQNIKQEFNLQGIPFEFLSAKTLQSRITIAGVSMYRDALSSIAFYQQVSVKNVWKYPRSGTKLCLQIGRSYRSPVPGGPAVRGRVVIQEYDPDNAGKGFKKLHVGTLIIPSRGIYSKRRPESNSQITVFVNTC